jgi:hypothetical protein
MPRTIRIYFRTESSWVGAPQGTGVRKYSFTGQPQPGDPDGTSDVVGVRGTGAVEVEIPDDVSVHLEEGGYAEGPKRERLGALQVVLKAARGEGGYRLVDAESARAALGDATAASFPAPSAGGLGSP